MRILLTNDDGIDAPGLQLLFKSLNTKYDVWVIAPERERSASSHSITLKKPICLKKRSKQVFTCSGTPADCVLTASRCIIPDHIDMIISGINHGLNLGTDIIYSGTVAAARQGALMGKPSIAISLPGNKKDLELAVPVEFIVNNIEVFYSVWSENHFLNINFPEEFKYPVQTCITFPSKRIYKDKFSTFDAPNGDLYCFLHGDDADSHNEEGSDHSAIRKGIISLSPVLIHPSNHKIEEIYQNANFWKGNKGS